MKLYFDGACAPTNPGGYTAWGFVADDGVGHQCKRFGFLGKGRLDLTNNVAEYTALVEGLRFIKGMGCRSVDVYGDSQLIIRQITGEYRCLDPKLATLRTEALGLVQGIASTFNWFKRENNTEADSMSRCGIALGMSLDPDFASLAAYELKMLTVTGSPRPQMQMKHLTSGKTCTLGWMKGQTTVQCYCQSFRESRNTKMCEHIAALFMGRRCTLKPKMLSNDIYEIEGPSCDINSALRNAKTDLTNAVRQDKGLPPMAQPLLPPPPPPPTPRMLLEKLMGNKDGAQVSAFRQGLMEGLLGEPPEER